MLPTPFRTYIMENVSPQPLPQSTLSPRWSRDPVVQHLFGHATDGAPLSERAYAALKKIPPSTLRGWRTRMEEIDDDPRIKAFFESPAGLKVLNRILVAAHSSGRPSASPSSGEAE